MKTKGTKTKKLTKAEYLEKMTEIAKAICGLNGIECDGTVSDLCDGAPYYELKEWLRFYVWRMGETVVGGEIDFTPIEVHGGITPDNFRYEIKIACKVVKRGVLLSE